MSKSKPKSLSELLDSPTAKLGQLASRARSKINLTDHVRKGLEPKLAGEIVNCSVDDDGTMVVRASSSEWASRLRFESETLLTLGRKFHPEATSVKVRVAHPGY